MASIRIGLFPRFDATDSAIISEMDIDQLVQSTNRERAGLAYSALVLEHMTYLIHLLSPAPDPDWNVRARDLIDIAAEIALKCRS